MTTEDKAACPVLSVADRARLATFGTMVVIATDQFSGRLYRCACGWKGWTVWGHANRHALFCDQSGQVITELPS